MEAIAHIRTDFKEKFGIPRQSGMIDELAGSIYFEPKYQDANAFRGLEEYSHIWLLWEFSENKKEEWSPMVKPPRLGGKKRMGVFATRSPFRPNNIGLSCVKLEAIEYTKNHGPVLHVLGIDLLDNTPIYDIKPYIPYADCYVDAKGGFGEENKEHTVAVNFPKELLEVLPKEKQAAAMKILSLDPKPAYQSDPDRKYGVAFAGYDIRFKIKEDVLNVVEVVKL